MGQIHSSGGHHHHHHHHHHGSDAKLSIAVLINVILSVLQIIFGVISGSLSLIADALHNLSDAGAIFVAIVARKIARKPSDAMMTYGYRRAEIVGVLINSTTLVVVGIYLIYEAIIRYLNPAEIDGHLVFWVAGIAFLINSVTALLTYSAGADDNMNIKAAFIHNISDAAASLMVILAGWLIIQYQFYFVDVLATLIISVYIIYHGVILLKQAIKIIMQAVPDNINLTELRQQLESIDGLACADHIHVWQLDDKRILLEGHLKLSQPHHELIKEKCRSLLSEQFGIEHTTLETEYSITGAS